MRGLQRTLDRPLVAQYVLYLANVVTGRFGTSFLTGQPAGYQILTLLPHTVILGSAAILISMIFGIPLGTLAAVRRGRPDGFRVHP